MRRVVPLLAVAALAATPASAHAAKKPTKPKPPPGAIYVMPQNLKAVGAVACARVGGQWHAGKLTRSGHFLTFARQAGTVRRDAKRLKGAKRAARLKSAARLDRKATQGRTVCRLRVPTIGGVPSPQPAGAYTPPTTSWAPQPLRVDLRSAVGLATRDLNSMYSAGAASNLRVIAPDGEVRPAVTSGTVPVSRFLIAPNGRAYVLFAQRTNLDDTANFSGGAGCLLAELDRESDRATCIDSTLAYITWDDDRRRNPPVQFDAAGNAYYTGSTVDGRQVLRRSRAGVTTDLVTEQASLQDFLVLEDGTVLLSGYTTTTASAWLRRLSPDDGLRTLRPATSSFLRRFPDGNVYAGVAAQGESWGVRRYVVADDAIDPVRWIGSSWDGDVRHSTEPFCSGGGYEANPGFCGSSGTSVQQTFTTTNDELYAIAGHAPNGELWRYYPDLARPATAVRKVIRALGVVTNIVLSGLDAENRHVTTILDTSTGEERVLLAGISEVEIYHLGYVAATNRVVFDGLRFSDNRYVLGEIDLSTGRSTTTPIGDSRFQDLASFG